MSRVVTLVNRTDKDFPFSFDGVSYTVPASGPDEPGMLNVTEHCALHGRKKSIMLYDLGTGQAQYQVGIDGLHDVSYLGKAKDEEEELIDRSTDPEGRPSRLKVRGGEVRREDEDVLGLK